MHSKNILVKSNNIIGIIYFAWCLALPWSLAAMQILAACLVVSTLAISIYYRRSPVNRHPFFIFYGLYIASLVLTIVSAPNQMDVLISTINNDWFLLLLPFLIFLKLPDNWLRHALWALLISSSLAGIYGVIQFFFGIEYIRDKPLKLLGAYYRATGGYGGFFEFAGNQLMTFGLAIALFVQYRRDFLYSIFPLVCLLAIVASQTRSTWLAVVVVIILIVSITKRKYLLHAVIFILLFGVVLFASVPDLQARFESIFNPLQNQARLNIWKTSLAIFWDHPLTGIGHGNFDLYFDEYRVPGFYDAQGHAHNDYLNIAVLNGLTGLCTWLGMWIFWFWQSVKYYRMRDINPFDRSLLLGGILSLSGILIASFFQCYYSDLENNIFWWFIISLNLIIIQKVRADQ